MAPVAPDGAASLDAPPPKLSKQRAAELALVGVCLFWGTSFIIVKRAFEDTSPLVFSGLRFLCGLVTLLPIYARKLRREYLRGALIVGGLLFCGFSTQAAGLNRTTPTRSAFITALCIPLTPIFQSALYRRRPRPLDLLGAFVAATGTFLLTSGGGDGGDDATADGSSGGGSALNTGDWLTLLCAVLFAFHMLALNHWGKGDALPTIAVGQVAVTMALSLLFCDVFETAVFRPTLAVLAAIVVTGTLCTALAFTVLAWAQTHTSATRAAIICSTGAALRCVGFALRAIDALASQRACLPRSSRTCSTAKRFPGWLVLGRC